MQVSGKGEVRIDGRAPKGLRERVWAWLTLWQVNRAIRSARKDAGLTDAQKAKRDLDERSRYVLGSLRRHYLMVASCAVLVILCLFEARVCLQGEERLKAVGWAVGAVIWVLKGRKDYRTLQERRRERTQLLVDEVHDL